MSKEFIEETKEQIQGGWTPEMIEEISKDPKYESSAENTKKAIDKLVKKETEAKEEKLYTKLI